MVLKKILSKYLSKIDMGQSQGLDMGLVQGMEWILGGFMKSFCSELLKKEML